MASKPTRPPGKGDQSHTPGTGPLRASIQPSPHGRPCRRPRTRPSNKDHDLDSTRGFRGLLPVTEQLGGPRGSWIIKREGTVHDPTQNMLTLKHYPAAGLSTTAQAQVASSEAPSARPSSTAITSSWTTTSGRPSDISPILKTLRKDARPAKPSHNNAVQRLAPAMSLKPIKSQYAASNRIAFQTPSAQLSITNKTLQRYRTHTPKIDHPTPSDAVKTYTASSPTTRDNGHRSIRPQSPNSTLVSTMSSTTARPPTNPGAPSHTSQIKGTKDYQADSPSYMPQAPLVDTSASSLVQGKMSSARKNLLFRDADQMDPKLNSQIFQKAPKTFGSSIKDTCTMPLPRSTNRKDDEGYDDPSRSYPQHHLAPTAPTSIPKSSQFKEETKDGKVMCNSTLIAGTGQPSSWAGQPRCHAPSPEPLTQASSSAFADCGSSVMDDGHPKQQHLRNIQSPAAGLPALPMPLLRPSSSSTRSSSKHIANNTMMGYSGMTDDGNARTSHKHESNPSNDTTLPRNQHQVHSQGSQSRTNHEPIASIPGPDGSNTRSGTSRKATHNDDNQNEAQAAAASSSTNTPAESEYMQKLLGVRGDSVLLLETYEDAMRFQETYSKSKHKTDGEEDVSMPKTDQERHYFVRTIARAMMNTDHVPKRKPGPDADHTRERAKKRRMGDVVSPHNLERQTPKAYQVAGRDDSGNVLWIKQMPTVLFQIKAWEILYDLEAAQQGHITLSNSKAGRQGSELQLFPSFLERFSALVATLRVRKDLVVRLFDAPFAKILADKPRR
ncbi:hypothetical protein N0V93_006178 [Gnomoniopsis smithogilvyi]|uniref:Uncharacterized protein n=1 Tax=Gnomoniopsis smithogilvyi TaxID=1191159 RepID=A0A9W8YPC8_9PEZI|nr:hypothetical protein N0V93_006178 [Gnomoniopsis smithogilvyi]